MGALHDVPAPRMAAGLLALVAVAAACGGESPSNVASHSPSAVPSSPAAQSSPSSVAASPSPSPPPRVTGAYGVLFSSQAAASYTVSLIGVDGKVAASAQTSTPPQ